MEKSGLIKRLLLFDHVTQTLTQNSEHSLKAQIFGVQYLSRYAAKQDIVDYIEMFYNSRRSHSYLGYTSPMEFEKRQLLEKAA